MRRDEVYCHELDDEAVLYDDAGNTTIRLNRTAYALWQCCDGRTTPTDMARALSRTFDVSDDTARVDVAGFIAEMTENGLLRHRPQETH